MPLMPSKMDVNVRLKEINLPNIEMPPAPESAVWLGAMALATFTAGDVEEATAQADAVATAYRERYLSPSYGAIAKAAVVVPAADDPEAEVAVVGGVCDGEVWQKLRFKSALRHLRRQSGLSFKERGAITRVLANGEMLEEFMARFSSLPQVVGAPGDWIDDLGPLIELIIELAPVIIDLIMLIISLF